jgi:hypothetical protein
MPNVNLKEVRSDAQPNHKVDFSRWWRILLFLDQSSQD